MISTQSILELHFGKTQTKINQRNPVPVKVTQILSLNADVSQQECTGWGCSSVGRTSDRYAAEAGSIPRCGEGFFSQSPLLVQTLLRRPLSPVWNRLH